MTVYHNRSAESGLPVIAAIPPLAAVIIRMLVSLRASIVYGIGTFAFLIPAGIAADDLGRVIGYGAVCGLLLIICSVGFDSRSHYDDSIRELSECRNKLRRLADDIAENANRD